MNITECKKFYNSIFEKILFKPFLNITTDLSRLNLQRIRVNNELYLQRTEG